MTQERKAHVSVLIFHYLMHKLVFLTEHLSDNTKLHSVYVSIITNSSSYFIMLQHLRLYFSVELLVTADILSLIVSGVLTDLGEMTGRMEEREMGGRME